MSKYKIVAIVSPKGVCHLMSIENVPAWAQMQQGESQAGKFPEDAFFRMSDDFPKDVKLADALFNISSMLVVSERFAEFLKKEKFLAHNEVHPVAILNHKGRREKAKYFIVQQIDNPRCVDAARTKGKKSRILPDEYNVMQKLVIDEKKVKKEYALFRAYEYKDRVLVRADVAAKVEGAGFTGIEFHDLEGYDDYW